MRAVERMMGTARTRSEHAMAGGDLPPALGCGSGHTAWRRLRQWQGAGVWEKLHRAVLEELSEQEILDWSRASIDAVSVRAKRGAS